jgi:hypothetical protein
MPSRSVGVIWDKTAVEVLGNGTIATAADGYTILRDAATVARNPSKYLPAEAGAAPASGNIIAYGYSQTGGLLRGWYFDHLNGETGTPAFNGGLVGGAAGRCRASKTCGGALADGGKVIDLLTETDVEWGGDAERGVNPDYRVIEIAGVSHISASAADFRSHGMPEQNPVGFEPVFRAALVNLQEWLSGRDPPPSAAIDLSDAPPRNLECCGPVREAARDADGNAKGGVRLPHMTSPLSDGRKAGAPLGKYTGFALDYVKSNFFFVISRTFKPFPPEKIKELYPNHAAYVDAVTASTEDLVVRLCPEARMPSSFGTSSHNSALACVPACARVTHERARGSKPITTAEDAIVASRPKLRRDNCLLTISPQSGLLPGSGSQVRAES